MSITRISFSKTKDYYSSNNLLSLNTNGLCLFCYKECMYRLTRSYYDETSVQISRILSRHLNIDFPKLYQNSLTSVKGTKCTFDYAEKGIGLAFSLCEDCKALGNLLCKLYQQHEVVLMRLNSCTETFRNIMRSAERVPSRVSEFHRRNEMKPVEVEQVVMMKTAETIRKEIMHKSLYHVNIFPRVLLKKLPSPTTSVSKFGTELAIPRSQSAEEIPIISSLLGCIVSFWIVLSLSFLNVDELTKLKRLPRIISADKQAKQSQEATKMMPYRRKRAKSELEQEPVKKTSKVNEMSKNSQEIKTKIYHTPPQESIVENSPVPSFKIMLTSQYESEELSSSAGGTKVLRKEQIKSTSTKASKSESKERLKEQSYPLITAEDAIKAVEVVVTPELTNPRMRPKSRCSTKPMKVEEEQRYNFRKSEQSTSSSVSLMPTFIDTNSPYIVDFIDLDELQTSLASTIPNYDHACSICGCVFNSRAKLEKHRVVAHKMKKFVQCPICYEFYSCYYLLELHRKENSLCDLDQFSKQIELEDIAKPLFPHKARIIGDLFCIYSDCNEVFPSQEDLQVHLKAHGTFHCDICLTSFNKAHELALHEVRYQSQCASQTQDVGPMSYFKCIRCDYGSDQVQQFVSHFLRVHLDISPNLNECSICWKRFSLNTPSAIMDVHYETFHNITRKQGSLIYYCRYCNHRVPFLKKTQLTNHEKLFHNKGTTIKPKGTHTRKLGRSCPTKQSLGRHTTKCRGEHDVKPNSHSTVYS